MAPPWRPDDEMETAAAEQALEQRLEAPYYANNIRALTCH
jgi:hypothetical protein